MPFQREIVSQMLCPLRRRSDASLQFDGRSECLITHFCLYSGQTCRTAAYPGLSPKRFCCTNTHAHTWDSASLFASSLQYPPSIRVHVLSFPPPCFWVFFIYPPYFDGLVAFFWRFLLCVADAVLVWTAKSCALTGSSVIYLGTPSWFFFCFA